MTAKKLLRVDSDRASQETQAGGTYALKEHESIVCTTGKIENEILQVLAMIQVENFTSRFRLKCTVR